MPPRPQVNKRESSAAAHLNLFCLCSRRFLAHQASALSKKQERLRSVPQIEQHFWAGPKQAPSLFWPLRAPRSRRHPLFPLRLGCPPNALSTAFLRLSSIEAARLSASFFHPSASSTLHPFHLLPTVASTTRQPGSPRGLACHPPSFSAILDGRVYANPAPGLRLRLLQPRTHRHFSNP